MGSQLQATGFTEVRDQHFVSALMRPGDTFIDVGANIGLYGVTAGRRGSVVAAFEPTERAADIAQSNLRLNGIEGKVHRVALGSEEGTVGFSTGDLGAHIDPRSTFRVPLRRLDSLDLPDGDLTFLKVDAECHDLEVLEGGLNFLRERRPVLLVEIWASTSREVRKLLSPLGYQYFDYSWRMRSLTDFSDAMGREGTSSAIHGSQITTVKARLAEGTY